MCTKVWRIKICRVILIHADDYTGHRSLELIRTGQASVRSVRFTPITMTQKL